MSFGYAKFARDFQAIRNSLVCLDNLALTHRHQDLVKISKGMSLVWMAASFESFWRSYLTELCHRVTIAPARGRRKQLATASLFFFDTLGTMGTGKKLRRWNRAVSFFEELPQSLTVCAAPTIPYDDRTVRPEHLELAWKLFGLSGNTFPSPIHKQELITLADRRNEVAHGNSMPQDVGGTVANGDLMRLAARLEDVAENCVLCAKHRWP